MLQNDLLRILLLEKTTLVLDQINKLDANEDFRFQLKVNGRYFPM